MLGFFKLMMLAKRDKRGCLVIYGGGAWHEVHEAGLWLIEGYDVGK